MVIKILVAEDGRAMTDVVIRFDAEGRHLFVSDNVEEALGIKASLFLNKTHRELGLSDDMCELWEGALDEVLDTGAPYETEFTFNGKCGRQVFRCQLIPEKGSDGSVISIISVLASRIETQHQKEQLIHADKMVALGTLISGFTHEINNPANFITLNAPLLRDAWSSVLPILDKYYDENGDFIVGGLNYSEMRDDVPALFAGIDEGASRIRNIVTDLKDFARISPEGMKEGVKINEVVASTLRLLNVQIKKASNALTVEYGSDIPDMKGNFQKLEQVVFNLVQNACHALPDADRGIMVKTDYIEEERCISVMVKDEGVGMTEEVLNHLMDPFFTTKRDIGGAGLGLSVSAGIVKDHGGTMNFSSKPDMGTTGMLKLPLDCGSNED